MPIAQEFEVPTDRAAWETLRSTWYQALESKVFAGWPDEPGSLGVRAVADLNLISSRVADGIRITLFEFQSQQHVPVQLHLVQQNRRRC